LSRENYEILPITLLQIQVCKDIRNFAMETQEVKGDNLKGKKDAKSKQKPAKGSSAVTVEQMQDDRLTQVKNYEKIFN
jgi:ribosome-binding protein aMBF1 (putative translation factor)